MTDDPSVIYQLQGPDKWDDDMTLVCTCVVCALTDNYYRICLHSCTHSHNMELCTPTRSSPISFISYLTECSSVMCFVSRNSSVMQCLGHLGRVAFVQDSTKCIVKVNGYLLGFHPKVLIPAPGEVPPVVPGMMAYSFFSPSMLVGLPTAPMLVIPVSGVCEI